MSDGTTKRGYIAIVLEVMRLCIEEQERERGQEQGGAGGKGGGEGRSGRLGCGPTGLTPRLLLSIDRSGDLAEAQDTVALALDFAVESPLVR